MYITDLICRDDLTSIKNIYSFILLWLNWTIIFFVKIAIDEIVVEKKEEDNSILLILYFLL